MTLTVATIGNPNSGKTSLFNALTGANQHVGNWSGVTVEKKMGYFNVNADCDVQVIDEVADLFEATDVRGVGGILGYEGTMLRNIGKYPDNQGYDNVPILRYEELVLNYAEALFETGGDALTQLNKIPANRGASAYGAATKENILLERRKELMFEGFRFDDLLRTGSDIEKISIQQNFLNTIPYGDSKLAYGIPIAETDANSNIAQNKGY